MKGFLEQNSTSRLAYTEGSSSQGRVACALLYAKTTKYVRKKGDANMGSRCCTHFPGGGRRRSSVLQHHFFLSCKYKKINKCPHFLPSSPNHEVYTQTRVPKVRRDGRCWSGRARWMQRCTRCRGDVKAQQQAARGCVRSADFAQCLLFLFVPFERLIFVLQMLKNP